ncbi:hypothetical protein BDV25DRAFT_124332 [Aspergillus avenaceus]|uniref:Uncharacterized protein n=1 Tax=Aspergillus avenaceus TaxID=36643 RepID=A0A5N6TTD9_ASPAV|nr:hypothetical protein BDV25DRAFT_124332 [Aspergillus avenaceus]
MQESIRSSIVQYMVYTVFRKIHFVMFPLAFATLFFFKMDASCGLILVQVSCRCKARAIFFCSSGLTRLMY